MQSTKLKYSSQAVAKPYFIAMFTSSPGEMVIPRTQRVVFVG